MSAQALRVLHVGKFYPPASGGMESHVQTLARAQSMLGASVEVLCVNHGASADDVSHEFEGKRTATRVDWDGGIRVTRVGRWASVSRLDLVPALPRELRAALKRGVDVVHLHGPNPTASLVLAAMPGLPPLVVTHHSDVVRQRIAGALFRPIESLLYHRASAVLATSAPYLEGSVLLRRFRGKVQPLPLGIDLQAFLSPSPASLQSEQRLRAELGAPLWLMVGRLVYYKGLFTALEALREVEGRLLVVGVGPLRSALKSRVLALGLEQRVVLAGYMDPASLAGAYRAATALWFPSTVRSEAFGLSQVEAMASGLPVINTSVPDSGVSWVSPHEETGLTVSVESPRELADASRRLLEEAGLRERLSFAARERARRTFDHRLMAERSLRVYEQVRDGSYRPATEHQAA